jgi:hypothetical protein
LVCSFDPTSLRINAYEIHELIHKQLKVKDHSALMIQIDGTRRQVFIKFTESTFVTDILNTTNGIAEYKHMIEEISPVRLELAGMGTWRIILANLPPELSGTAVRVALAPYGVIQSVNEETWSQNYRYVVANGIRVVTMSLNKHLPLHVNIAGYRALVSYEGQPQTCYGCGETDHMYQMCPKRRRAKPNRNDSSGPTWDQRTAADPHVWPPLNTGTVAEPEKILN